MTSRVWLLLAGALLAGNAPGLAAPIATGTMPMNSDTSRDDVQRINKLLSQKQVDAAAKEVDSLKKQRPDDPTVLILQGTVYLAKHDLAGARASFERASELKPGSVAPLLNLAQVDLLENKPEAAQQRLQSILVKDPANVDAMLGMAEIAGAAGRDADLQSWLQRATSAGRALRPRVLLASYYLKKNKSREALAVATEALAINGTDPQVLDILGASQLAMGDTAGAIATYESLVKVASQSAVAHYKLASAQISAGRLPAARVSLSRALQLKPDFLDARVLLANVELSGGRADEAFRMAKQIEKQYPKSSVGPTLEGDLLMQRKQYDAARQMYEKALAIRESGVVTTKLHKALSASGKSSQADDMLLRWIRAHPADLATRVYLAAHYTKSGRNKQAIEQYEYILERDRGDPTVLNELALIYQQDKDPRALSIAEQAYQIAPGNAAIVDTLGWVLTTKGDTNRGLQLLREAAQLAPTSPVIRYHLAAALAQVGDNVRARSELEQLLADNAVFQERTEAEALLSRLKN